MSDSQSQHPVLSFTMKLGEQLNIKRLTKVCSIIYCHGGCDGAEWNYKIDFPDMENVAKFSANYQSLIKRKSEEPDWYQLSRSNKLTWEFVMENIDEEWNWYALSINPIITFDIIINHINLPWEHGFVSMNPNITIRDVEAYFGFPWDWNELSYNSGIKIDDIMSYSQWPWCWKTVSLRKDINIDVVKKYRNAPWSWKGLTLNPNIMLQDIVSNNDMPWEGVEIKCEPMPVALALKKLEDAIEKWSAYENRGQGPKRADPAPEIQSSSSSGKDEVKYKME